MGFEFPVTLQKAHCEIIGNDITFTNYVVCSKCHSLYDFEKCIEVCGSNRTSCKCKFVQFPNHTKSCRHQYCETPLLRSVKKGSLTSFKLFKVYSYQSLKDAITRLLKRKGFLEMCEQWKYHHSVDGILGDIFDGQVWKDSNFSFQGIQLVSFSECRLVPTTHTCLRLSWSIVTMHIKFST